MLFGDETVEVDVFSFFAVVLNFSVRNFCCHISSEIAGRRFITIWLNSILSLTVAAIATELAMVYESHITVIMINAMLLHNCFGAESFKHRFQIPAVRA
ncbi:hypothetical protein RDI58_012811 [Solanum bulbocastanum]|uniref:Uncharacterized protein n=1 Tax=Solanum bulbocastanum TaxID=147425 RepID=A0AAN8YE01_SOLBU